MRSLNLEVIRSTSEWLNKGQAVWFVTIIKTWGASPRPEGSLFAYNPVCDEQNGSLSGGCIEQDLVIELRSQTTTNSTSVKPLNKPFIKQYGRTEEHIKRFQLPCGGQLELMIEFISPCKLNQKIFDEIALKLTDRQRVLRRLTLSTGEFSVLDAPSEISTDIQLSSENLDHVMGPEYRLLIVGVGDVSKYLIEMAKAVDFSVSVCDPRMDFIRRYRLDDTHIELIHCLPDDLVRDRFNDEYCSIVALSHDPRVDDLALMEALQSEAFYVGAMGSVKTSEDRVTRLKQLGINTHQLSKLHAPIGLAINSKTPAEIAISIISQLIQYRYSHVKK